MKNRTQRNRYSSLYISVLILFTLILSSFFASPGLAAGKPTSTPPPTQGSFNDSFDTFDTSRWAKADAWANGSPFDNAWRADHINFANSLMTITMDNTPYLGE